MSDVLIKNREMPKQCWNNIERCPFHALDYRGKSHCELSDGIRCLRTKRPKDCPLVEVPEHGDLIDRNELPIDTVTDFKNEGISVVLWEDVMNAPVIVEASYGSDN